MTPPQLMATPSNELLRPKALEPPFLTSLPASHFVSQQSGNLPDAVKKTHPEPRDVPLLCHHLPRNGHPSSSPLNHCRDLLICLHPCSLCPRLSAMVPAPWYLFLGVIDPLLLSVGWTQ